MKKIVVDKEKCIKCGACVAIVPNTFDFDEEGFSKVINESVNEDAMSGLEACPVIAISVVGDDSCNCANGETCTCEETCECTNCSCDSEEE